MAERKPGPDEVETPDLPDLPRLGDFFVIQSWSHIGMNAASRAGAGDVLEGKGGGRADRGPQIRQTRLSAGFEVRSRVAIDRFVFVPRRGLEPFTPSQQLQGPYTYAPPPSP